MQTWAKRGIQTALVTGGLLMLGTSIASADEDVNPDKAASALDGTPIDASVSVPLNIANNGLGTPIGEMALPNITREVSVDGSEVTGNLANVAPEAVAPIIGSNGDALRGNRVAGDLVVPIDLSGNAIAAGGDVAVANTSDQAVTVARPQETSGKNDFLAGNVADLDYALPFQITGNAVSAVGNAASTNSSSQQSAAIGDIKTDGTGGTVSGNVVAPQGATPVQATGNAISGLGTATATAPSDAAKAEATGAATKSAAGGSIFTGGALGTGTGNVGAAALALPVELNANAIGAGATSTTATSTEAAATAGGASDGLYDRPTYIQTNGNPSAVGGNVAQVPVAGPASVNCNAASGLGIADASCAATSPTQAGGTTQTNGTGSLVGGTVASTPVALPTEGFGNAGSVAGDAIATMDNTVDSKAGGESFTFGDQSTGGGSVVGSQVSGPVDVFSNAVGGAGDAVAVNNNDSNTESGTGFSGTLGDESFAGGSVVNAPVSLPAEGFGNVGGALGNASSTTTEVKTSSSGGDDSSVDDGGFGAANVGQAALAGPIQVLGNGVGAAGNTSSTADVVNTVTAGGDTKASGTVGTIAGNIAAVPVSLPGQVFGSNVTAGGVGVSDATVDTTSTAGGTATTDGTNGAVVGNVVHAPVGSAAQLFGDSAAALGQSSAIGSGVTNSTAGGDTTTSGMGGFVSGNAATPQAMPIAQALGTAVAGVGGLNDATGDNDTVVSSGGNVLTNGDQGTISGNLADVPAGVTPVLTGDAVSAIGSDAVGTGASNAVGTAGGASTTSGVNGFLSGLDATLPAGVNTPVYGVPVEVLAEALAQATSVGDYQIGEAQPMVDMGLDGSSMSGLPATSVPKLPMLSEFPSTPELTSMPELSDLTALPELSDVSALPGLPELPEMPAQSRIDTPVPGLDMLGSVTGLLGGVGAVPNLPALPGAGGGVPNLPGVPGGGALPVGGNLPVGGDLAGGLPGLDMLGAVTGLAGGLGESGLPTAALPQVPGTSAVQQHLPSMSSLQEHLPALPGGPVTGSRADSPLPSVPGLGPVTNLLGALMGGAAHHGLPQMPAMPAGAQAGQLPSLPGVGAVPGMPSVPGLPNLTQTPALQLPTVGKLPVQPELSGVNTSTVLGKDSGSLADTKTMLAKLLGEHPIG
jgi:trimeric autotransporter adhesin